MAGPRSQKKAKTRGVDVCGRKAKVVARKLQNGSGREHETRETSDGMGSPVCRQTGGRERKHANEKRREKGQVIEERDEQREK